MEICPCELCDDLREQIKESREAKDWNNVVEKTQDWEDHGKNCQGYLQQFKVL